MSELRADTLSPIDAATLWPQLHRLGTEVIAHRGQEHILVASGLAATGLGRLPRVPRTAVLGVRRGLRYRGVVVARELDGGVAWELVSARLERDKDDDALAALLGGASQECAGRGARMLLLRYPEGSPHGSPLRRSGFSAHTLERLHAVPARPPVRPLVAFREARRQDRAALFRLYCRSVPEHVRRQEATTQPEWRGVLDSYECGRGYVLDRDGILAAWIGAGEREGRLLIDPVAPDVIPAAMDFLEAHVGRHGTFVIAEYQPEIEREAMGRGYTPLGTRLLSARRLALRNPLKEAAKIPVAKTVPYA